MIEEIQHGYRVTYADGFSFEHLIGSGHSCYRIAVNKVVWINQNSSGVGQLIRRAVITGDWEVVDVDTT